MAEKLTTTERDEALAPLLATGWETRDDRDALQKTFTFGDFALI